MRDEGGDHNGKINRKKEERKAESKELIVSFLRYAIIDALTGNVLTQHLNGLC